jgi:1-pyrroline-5-carboxylate dehydrogenase
LSSAKVTYVSLIADESIHPRYEAALREVEAELGLKHPFYVGGEEVWGKEVFAKSSPIDTSIRIGEFQVAEKESVLRAIAIAKQAFRDWSRRDWRERTSIIRRAADVLEREMYRLAALITYEVGKNRFEALAEMGEAIDMLRYYADTYEAHEGYVRAMKPGAPGEQTRSVLRPYGVWAVISPFNFPIALAAGMITGALLTGNTVVFKPTSEAPLSGLKLYRAFIEGGVPEEALHVITGPGDIFGEIVVKHQDIMGIAFTGSRDVGMRLYKQFVASQPYPKPFIAEMGSKNPVIVTAKADLDKAVEGTVRAAYGYGGQKCSAASRLYVEAGIYDEFMARLAKRTRELKVGDPRLRESFLGPVINRTAYVRFQEAVSEAIRDGGKIEAGGRALKEGVFERGYYVEPTLISGLRPEHRLFRDELFLPLLVAAKFSTLEEALRMANDTEYGLTAGIFSEDEEEIRFFFERIEFGVVYANRKGGATTGAWPGAQAFGGWKASGSTGRGVGGPYYLLSYLREQAQTVVR